MGKVKQSTQQPEEVSAERSFVADFLRETQKEYIKFQGMGDMSKEAIKSETKDYAEYILSSLSEENTYKGQVSAELTNNVRSRISQYVENLGSELASQNTKLTTELNRAKKENLETIEWAGQKIDANLEVDYVPMTAALESKFTKHIDILQDKTKTDIDIESVIKSIMDKPPSLFQQLVNGIANGIQQIRDGIQSAIGVSRPQASALAKNDSLIKTESVNLDMKNQQQQVQQKSQPQVEKQNSQRLNKTKQLVRGMSGQFEKIRENFVRSKTTSNDSIPSVQNPNQEKQKGGR